MKVKETPASQPRCGIPSYRAGLLSAKGEQCNKVTNTQLTQELQSSKPPLALKFAQKLYIRSFMAWVPVALHVQCQATDGVVHTMPPLTLEQ